MWWITDQERLGAEKAAIAAIDDPWFENPDWSFDQNVRLRLIFDLVLNHGRFRLSMVYHQTFPASPPSVIPINDTRLSGHQYGPGGDLCLEIRNDNWTPDVTGADMIRSAHKLLTMEMPDEVGAVASAPSAHDFPDVLVLRNAYARFYVSRSARLALELQPEPAVPIKASIDHRGGRHMIAHLVEWGVGDLAMKNPDVSAAYHEPILAMEGQAYKAVVAGSLFEMIEKIQDLETVVGEAFSLCLDDDWVCIVQGTDNVLKLFVHFGGKDELVACKTVLAQFEPKRSGDACSALSDKRVAIVGLGSLGSKIATSLARAGVGRFDLIDGDVLHAGNLERHDADWRDVGRHKADLGANRLCLINAQVAVHPWRTAIGAQVSSEEAGNVNGALSACDLIVDATGNPDVFNHVSFIAMRSNRALIWGAIYAGGLGGEVARSRPLKDPSPYEIRAVMNQAYEASDDPPPIAVGRGYDGAQEEKTPLIATDADVTVIAGHVTAMTLDALIDTEPSAYPYPAYLIGLKRGWLFEAPFDTQPLNVAAPLRTSNSPSGEVGVESDFIISLLKKSHDETEDQPTDD